MFVSIRRGIALACLGSGPAPGWWELHAQPVQLDPQFVTAARAPQPAEFIAATLKVVEADTIRRMPAATLDGALRSIPAFSLFRRSDSLTAHPTAQGVSLRGLGPSGASRSLVLLDGIPLNDPFGGWVAWTKVPRESLTRVELVPGGGSSAWGNAALGGVVHLLGEAATVSSGNYAALIGDFETRSLELAAAHATEHDTVQVRGRAFATNGFSLMAPERRGAIDIPAWSRHRWASGGWRHSFAGGLHLAANARVFEEKRGNGTAYQQNGSREKFASLHAGGDVDGDFAWTAVAYAQDQSFASTFSAVNATRTAETPASDQFAVPATAFGAAWTGRWRHASGRTFSHTSAGIDTRWVRGETREHFTFTAGNFTRQRVAGGRQDVSGVFGFHERRVLPDVRATLGARFDRWRDNDGHRHELDRVTGATLRQDRYADRDGTAFSPSAGVVWQPSAVPSARVRAHVQRAYRRPTLNELYRPFRVGPNVTEANPALGTERVNSAELGVEWSGAAGPGPRANARAASPLTLGAVFFRNDLRDAVGNVTIARGPGTFPIVGFVAAGGVGRQRLSLERTRVQGTELSARWRPSQQVLASAEYLYNDATITRTTLAPALVGKRIAQVPRHAAAISGTITGFWDVTFAPRVRWMGRQFEDDENQLILGEVVVVDVGVSRPLGRRTEVFINAENVSDARIETGRTADGLVNVGTPRFVTIGVRGAW